MEYDEALELLLHKAQTELKDLEMRQQTLTIQARDIDAQYKLNNIKIKLLTDYLRTYTPAGNNTTPPKHKQP